LTVSTRALETELTAIIRNQVGGMRKNAGWTESMSAELQTTGVEEVFDPLTFKPKFKSTVMPGSVLHEFIKGPSEGVNVYCRIKGTAAWKFVARDTNSPYEDHTPLAQAGVAENREYAMRGVKNDAEFGLMSDIVSVTFAG
jgi:hypothetical protein